MPPSALHLADAVRLLEDRQPHKLKLWKQSTGDIIYYHGATVRGTWTRGGLHRVTLPNGDIHTFRDVMLLEIDDLPIYL